MDKQAGIVEDTVSKGMEWVRELSESGTELDVQQFFRCITVSLQNETENGRVF
jgi:hypothetical protein